MTTDEPNKENYGIRTRTRNFAAGFLLFFVPMLLLGLFLNHDIEGTVFGAVVLGLITGTLAAVYGRPMLKFLVKFMGDGMG